MIDRSRRAAIRFTTEELASMLALPGDATVLALRVDPIRDIFDVVVQHQNLDQVHDRAEAPLLDRNELHRIAHPMRLPVVLDPDLPPGVVELRNDDGTVAATITSTED